MTTHADRLSALRNTMKTHGIDATIIPQADQWQAESLFPCDERLHYICGLDASAGFCVVTMDKAAVLIDGRYTVQAKEQVDPSLFDIAYYTDILPEDWATENIRDGGVIGIDPWLFTRKDLLRFDEKETNITFIRDNLVDQIWTDRPSAPNLVAIAHALEFAGKSTAEKMEIVADNCNGLTLIAAPDCLAWLLNLRVLENTQAPGIRGYGLFDPDQKHLTLYTDVDCSVFNDPAHLTVKPLGEITSLSGIIYTSKNIPAWFETQCDIIEQDGPCALPKACKNTIEQQGIRDSHARDAIAMKNAIAWIKSNHGVSEKQFAEKLIEERSKQNMFRGVSFDSIVGWNANGAKIHGSPTNTIIEGNGLLLIDSGGQYDDGTTDITRTIAIGQPTETMKEKYTLVLRAHIALATAIFPAGTTGKQIDTLCRAPLWAAGIDYAHGTGHGVGHFLNVHEGPCGISPRSDEPLREGMLLSNEPGYYKEGAFGIRLENLMLVQKYKDKDDPANETSKDLLCFETVTFVPFDDDCIIRAMLAPSEIKWLEDYQRVSLGD